METCKVGKSTESISPSPSPPSKSSPFCTVFDKLSPASSNSSSPLSLVSCVSDIDPGKRLDTKITAQPGDSYKCFIGDFCK